MITVHYPFSLPYRNFPGAGLVPALEVDLHYNGQSTRALGLLDSGSAHTVFSLQIAESLGIVDLHEGELVHAATMGGPAEYFLFDLEMALVTKLGPLRFPARVGFFPVKSPRNILGRIVVFSRFEFGFRERTQRIQVRPEE